MTHTTPTSGAADLRTAAQAVVDRWDTPLWKDVPATAEYIGRLRAALAAGQATAAQAVVPAGWKLVPVDATDDMLRAIRNQRSGGRVGAGDRADWAAWLAAAPTPAAQADSVLEDAARYRWLAAHCRSTSEHWGGRWSIIIDGPAPKSHDSGDDFDAAVDAARKQGASHDR